MKLPHGKSNRYRLLRQIYSVDEFNFPEFPPKVGGRVGRTIAGKTKHCPLCFWFRTYLCYNPPRTPYRSWKNYRQNQWTQDR